MKRRTKTLLTVIAAILVCAAVAWAGTVIIRPYGVATPYWFGYSAGVKTDYYLSFPTLSANDEAAGIAATQTLTNKTFSSPTISGTVTGTGVISATNVADVVRYYQLQIMSAVSTDGVPVTDSTAPGLEIDDLLPNIVWADGETTPITITFRIPDDYASGGAFKVLATESDSSTPNQVDFAVYVNADGVAADAAASDQTPVALAGTTSTPDEVTLTPGTDFASLAAGHWVTLRIWRDDVADGTGDLEVKGIVFYYTATQ